MTKCEYCEKVMNEVSYKDVERDEIVNMLICNFCGYEVEILDTQSL